MAANVEHADIPTFENLEEVFQSSANALRYLKEKGVLNAPEVCPNCNNDYMPLKKGSHTLHRCSMCHHQISITHNSIFRNHKLGFHQILRIFHLFMCKVSVNSIKELTGHEHIVIAAWIHKLFHVLQLSITNLGEESKIGGDGIIVQIDESKFGKRHGHMGHHVEGVWVVGGVELTDQRNCFAVAVENRDAATLAQIIHAHVRPGSHVYTDRWAGYRDEDLHQMGMTHDTVNHTYEFVDPVTGVTTNWVEGMWFAMKHGGSKVSIRHRTLDLIGEDLLVFVWRRRNEGRIWNAMLDALSAYVEEIGQPHAEIIPANELQNEQEWNFIQHNVNL